MAFRFRRSRKILPGVTLFLGKSGPSLRLGGRGAGVTFGPRGMRASAGLPGSGLSYSKQVGREAGPGWGTVGRIVLWMTIIIAGVVILAALLG